MNDAVGCFERPRVGASARTLTRAQYTDESVFHEEVEQIFGPGWVCVGRGAEAGAAGSAFVIEVLGESVILVRGQDGRLRGVFNVCRHRGARLCDTGRHDGVETIRCPYHSWTYGLDGRLLVAPGMSDVEGFEAEEHGLVAAGVEEWQGFAFVNLDGRAEGFLDGYPMLEGKFSEWGMPGLREGYRLEYDVKANWKQICENYSECYHCLPVHPQLARLSPATSGRNDLMDGPVLGGYSTFLPGVSTLTMSGRTGRRPLEGVLGEELGRVYFYVIFPNLLLSLHPDFVLAHVLSPIAADRTKITCLWLFETATIEAQGFDPSDAVEFWDLTNRQDWEMCERAQAGARSRSYTPGPYTHAEGLLDAFDREYRRRMGRDAGA